MQKPVEEIRTVIDYLDELMVKQPSRELADASNYLEGLLAGSDA